MRLVGNLSDMRSVRPLNTLSVNVTIPGEIVTNPENANEAIVVIPKGISTLPSNSPVVVIPVTIVFVVSTIKLYDIYFYY